MADLIEFFEHPEYKEMRDAWQTYRDLYEGKHSVLVNEKYLWKHELETTPVHGPAIRMIREQRSRYFNIMEAIVSSLVSICFKKDPEVEASVRELFGDDWQDVDGNGTDFISFLKGPVTVAYLRDGRPIVLTDAFDLQAGSLGEQKALRHRAFFEVLDVLSFKDWERETRDSKRHGRFNSFRYEYDAILPRSSLREAPKCVKHCRIFEKADTGYTVQTFHFEAPEKPTEQNPGEWLSDGPPVSVTALDEIPVSAIMHGESWVKDAAELGLVLFNLMSAYYNQLNYQAHQRVMLAGDLNNENLVAASEFSMVRLPQGTQVTVIEPGDTGSLERAIEKTVDQIYKVAFNQTKKLASTSNEAPGADTLREMKEEMIALILAALSELEGLANRMIKNYAVFKSGDQNFSGTIKLNKEITVEDIGQMIALFQAFADDLKPIDSIRKAVLKKAVQQMNLGGLEDLQKDIDSHEFGQPAQAAPQGPPSKAMAARADLMTHFQSPPMHTGSAPMMPQMTTMAKQPA
jgi:hypothetical protein